MARGAQTRHLQVGQFTLGKIGARRFDAGDPYHFALTIGWPAFVLYVFGAYVLITSIFAALYLLNPNSIANARPGAAFDAFFFSIETLATVGYGEMSPQGVAGHMIAAAELIVGMAFTAIMTGLVFVRFSKPRPKVLYADKAVIAVHNGVRTLMIRIGNGRLNMLTDTRMQLTALIREVSHEGHVSFNAHELRLVRDRTPAFPLLLTLFHVIDESSPLFGRDADNMVEAEVRLFLAVEARDPALAATVHDLRTYGHADILENMRYVDAVTPDEQGRAVADLTKISLIAPDPLAASEGLIEPAPAAAQIGSA